jgi:undecaprenyl-diphosphatase
VGTFGCLAVTAEKKWWKILCIVIAVLVGFSRMYVGVHTPADVLVGAAISVAALLVLYPLMLGSRDRSYGVFLALSAVSIAYLVVMELADFPADIDSHNLASAMKNAYTLTGCALGLLLVYPLEKRYVQFEEKAVWWVQLLKIVLGLGLVLGVKEGLRAPLEAIFAGHLAARAVRYFLIVVVAGLLWPMTFKFFGKLGKKHG